jgi:hypothetical protein
MVHISSSRAQKSLLILSKKLKRYSDSVDAWKKALECIPEQGLSPAESKQKQLYEEGLWSAQSTLNIERGQETGLRMRVTPPGKWPWDRATELVSSTTRSGKMKSCVSSSLCVLS